MSLLRLFFIFIHNNHGGQEATDEAANHVEQALDAIHAFWEPVPLQELMYPETHAAVLEMVAGQGKAHVSQARRRGGTTTDQETNEK